MEWILYLIAAFIILDLIFVVYVAWKRKYKAISGKQREELLKFWSRIKGETDFNSAILNADKLLDKVLRIKGYSGSLGDKLKKSGGLFSDLDGIWSAHKLRNRVAHEMGMQISRKEAENAIRSYERAFKDLGLL